MRQAVMSLYTVNIQNEKMGVVKTGATKVLFLKSYTV